MKKILLVLLMLVVVGAVGVALHQVIFVQAQCGEAQCKETPDAKEHIILPSPRHSSEISVEEAIFRRRSVRRFADAPLTLEEVSQLLWAAGGKTVDGVTGPTRAFPSAGGLYPFEIYLVAGNVDDLADGIYRFDWQNHSIDLVKEGDFRHELMEASLRQGFVSVAPVSIVWVGDFARIKRFYGERGAKRYISMDVGGAGQNVHLQAEALNLVTVIVGAFRDEMVQDVLETELTPLYIMPVGRRG